MHMNSIPSVLIFLFILFNFFIGFFSDILLNITNFVPSLKSYFKNKTIVESAFYAGLTIIIALFIVMFISYVMFGFSVPLKLDEFYKFIILTAIVGYLADWYIYKAKVFGQDLNEYYEKLGIGFWGSAAFIVSVTMSYFLVKIYQRAI